MSLGDNRDRFTLGKETSHPTSLHMCAPVLQVTWGPRSLEQWLRFWQATPYNTFDLGYLMNWGARWVVKQEQTAACGRRRRLLLTMHSSWQEAQCVTGLC